MEKSRFREPVAVRLNTKPKNRGCADASLVGVSEPGEGLLFLRLNRYTQIPGITFPVRTLVQDKKSGVFFIPKLPSTLRRGESSRRRIFAYLVGGHRAERTVARAVTYAR